MAAFYRDARLKIKRANEHIGDLKVAISSLEDSQISTITVDAGTSVETVMYEFPNLEESLLRLSMIIGDALHNLRTSLDFAWYKTISRCLPERISASTKFPVRESRKSLEDTLHGIEIDTKCRPVFDCVMSQVQPYKGGHNSVVWALHELDISDKHLLLLEVVPASVVKGLTFRDENGQIYDVARLPFQGGGKYGVRATPGIRIHDRGKLSVDIHLKEAGIFSSLPALNLLNSFSQFTVYVVEELEKIG